MNLQKNLILICITAGLTSCYNNQGSNQKSIDSAIVLIDSMPYIKFERTMVSIGKIMSGEKAGMDFVFHNAGKQNLIILDAKVSCGCTVPEWDKIAILPGGKGKVRVVYDSSGELGMQNKSIRIISNARNRETDLIMSAEVIN